MLRHIYRQPEEFPMKIDKSLQASSFWNNVAPVHETGTLEDLHARLVKGAIYITYLSQYLLYLSLTVLDQDFMPNLLPRAHATLVPTADDLKFQVKCR